MTGMIPFITNLANELLEALRELTHAVEENSRISQEAIAILKSNRRQEVTARELCSE